MKRAFRIFVILTLLTWELIPAAGLFAAESDNLILKVTVLDSPPQGIIVINNGDDYTTSASVTLALTAWDAESSVEQMQFSNDGTQWSAPESFSATKSWDLLSGNGEKTVYVKFKDAVGNWSVAFSDTIILTDIVPTTIDYSYDDLNRLKTMTYSTKSAAYTYDEVGNILNKTTEAGAP